MSVRLFQNDSVFFIYFVLLYPSFCGERFICLRCVIGTRTIQSWFYHCKIGSRSVHCGSGESSYIHAFSPFSSFGLFVLFFGWAMENGSFRFRIWSYVHGWTKDYLLFFILCAACCRWEIQLRTLGKINCHEPATLTPVSCFVISV